VLAREALGGRFHDASALRPRAGVLRGRQRGEPATRGRGRLPPGPRPAGQDLGCRRLG
jgi:hypothetical protein